VAAGPASDTAPAFQRYSWCPIPAPTRKPSKYTSRAVSWRSPIRMTLDLVAPSTRHRLHLARTLICPRAASLVPNESIVCALLVAPLALELRDIACSKTILTEFPEVAWPVRVGRRYPHELLHRIGRDSIREGRRSATALRQASAAVQSNAPATNGIRCAATISPRLRPRPARPTPSRCRRLFVVVKEFQRFSGPLRERSMALSRLRVAVWPGRS
jgi:hypothetical protein